MVNAIDWVQKLRQPENEQLPKYPNAAPEYKGVNYVYTILLS